LPPSPARRWPRSWSRPLLLHLPRWPPSNVDVKSASCCVSGRGCAPCGRTSRPRRVCGLLMPDTCTYRSFPCDWLGQHCRPSSNIAVIGLKMGHSHGPERPSESTISQPAGLARAAISSIATYPRHHPPQHLEIVELEILRAPSNRSPSYEQKHRELPGRRGQTDELATACPCGAETVRAHVKATVVGAHDTSRAG
jgi:hypothetical protein